MNLPVVETPYGPNRRSNPRAREQMQVQTTFFKKLFYFSRGSRTRQQAPGVGGPAHMRSLLEPRNPAGRGDSSSTTRFPRILFVSDEV
jgi:hypothetical protein